MYIHSGQMLMYDDKTYKDRSRLFGLILLLLYGDIVGNTIRLLTVRLDGQLLLLLRRRHGPHPAAP